MAENKNQHYVPKCHLRPFAIDSEKAAINLYNCKLDRGIPNASIKGQCSRDYFYGEDLKIERILQRAEGSYAAAILELQEKPRVVSGAILSTIREFAYLQYSRTQNAVRRRREAFEAMHEISHRGAKNVVGLKIEPLDITHRSMILGTFTDFVQTRRYFHDLRMAIIHNHTTTQFVTSDDPAVLTNRVYLQMLGRDNFGAISCGVQLIMPLTPNLAFVAYDGDAYRASQRIGNWIPLTRRSDVVALNELQYLKCESNVYFQNWEQRDAIATAFRSALPRRPARSQRFWVGILDREDKHGDHYRRATKDEIASTATKIVSISPVFPTPARFFGGLTFRDKIWGWDSGTGLGLVREAYATSGHAKVPFERVRVHRGLRSDESEDGPKTAFHRRSQADRDREHLRSPPAPQTGVRPPDA